MAEDRFRLGGRNGCLQHLEFHLDGETWRYGDFVRDVFELVEPSAFHDSKPWPEPDGPIADEYGVSLTDGFVDRYGLRLRNWYLKFQLQSERKAEVVLVMSLHPLAFDMTTAGGTVKCKE